MRNGAESKAILRLTTEEKRKTSVFWYQRLIVTFGLTLTVALGLGACKEEQKTETVIRPVKAIVVAEQSVSIIKTSSDDVRPRTETALGFRVLGKTSVRLAEVGDNR